MRIATFSAFQGGIDNLQTRQQEMTDAMQQLTSGKRVERASDDPTAAARAERALAKISRSDANQRALEASRNAMSLADSALGDAGELMQQARETLVQAGNTSYSDSERLSLAEKLSSIRDQLLTVANRGDGGGGYLFGGQGSSQPPFVDAAGGVQFRGISGATAVASDEALPITLDGKTAWLQSNTGNGVFETRAVSSAGAWIDQGRVTNPSQLTGATYTIDFAVSGGATSYSVLKNGTAMTPPVTGPYVAGQSIEVEGLAFAISGVPANGDSFEAVPSTPSLSIFDTLDRTIADLKTPLRTSAQTTQSVQRAVRDIDSSSAALQGLRSTVGETLDRTDSIEGRVKALKVYGQTERSNAEDLDMVQAISDFENRQTGYDASLKTYSTVQRLSLFQYIS